MPFTKGQSDDRSELRDTAYGWGKIVARRAYGDEGPGLDLDFDSIESLAVDMGQAVIRGTVEKILKTQFQRLGDHQPCPGASKPALWPRRRGSSRFAAGRFSTTNPSAIARPVAGIFFPLRPTLRLDSHDFSPAILGKIVRAVARGSSFAAAAESLADEAEVQVGARHLGRIAHEVGGQLRDRHAIDGSRSLRARGGRPRCRSPPGWRSSPSTAAGSRPVAKGRAAVPVPTTPRGVRTRSPTW